MRRYCRRWEIKITTATEIDNLIRLQKDQVKRTSEMLALAFDDDEFFRRLVPDPEKRLVKAAHLFAFTLKLGLKYGEVYTTSPNLEGIAVWMPPQSVNVSAWMAIRCGVVPLVFRVGPRLLKKMNSADAYAERVRKRLAPDRYWYLALLGVAPDHQDKGHASALVKPMLKRIDGEGLPIYLETDGKKNVSMYQHFGFKVIERIHVNEIDIDFEAMVREPATASS